MSIRVAVERAAGAVSRVSRKLTLVLPILGAGCLTPASADDGVVTALIVSVDVSGSVDERRYTLQMEGIAEALEDPSVIQAITGNPGGIYFSMVTWTDKAQVAVEWRRIASKADALATAALVRAVPRLSGNFTCLGQMLRTVSARIVPSLPVQADRTVIDVSGDGIDNCTDVQDIHEQRDGLLAAGATINGLPILVPGENDVVGVGAYRAPGYGLRELPDGTYKEGTTLDKWYREHVIGGPGSFLMAAHGYGDFARALRQKFVIEISGLKPEPGTVASR